MVISAHAYPWDVIGDPGFVDRVLASEVDSVTLAASYHTTRAATPNHPSHKLVDVPYAALYRPVPALPWGRLTPRSFGAGPPFTLGAGPPFTLGAGDPLALGAGDPFTLGAGDPFAEAFAILHDAGIKVNAWIVLAHNTRLGQQFPDVAVVNCFGERYPYALCPSWTEVAEHCALLASAALSGVPVAGVSLESCGQMGLAHLGCHEKSDGAFTALQQKLLSICCCKACGVSASAVRAWYEAAIEPDEDVLAIRHAATDRLRANVLEAVRAEAPQAGVTLHAQADPWATGPSPGLTPAAAAEVDAVLMPCWPHTSTVTPGAHAYVSTLQPFGDGVAEHVRRLRADGAGGLALYHVGLRPDPAPLMASLSRLWRQG